MQLNVSDEGFVLYENVCLLLNLIVYNMCRLLVYDRMQCIIMYVLSSSSDLALAGTCPSHFIVDWVTSRLSWAEDELRKVSFERDTTVMSRR